MLIIFLLYVFSFVLSLFYLPDLIRGVLARNVRQCVRAVLIPALFWAVAIGLYSADRRFIREEEIRKNGGQIPIWMK
jgi:hypothetical protein